MKSFGGLAAVVLLGLLVLILSINYSRQEEKQELVCNYSPRLQVDDCMYFPILETRLNCYRAEDYRGTYWRCPMYRR